ncbi:hypothetical protein SAMN02799624_04308 [Paenibacillus sp. UNC496MF]|uniref:hypothetical protein n=1 Tax=Paenibacillus sp. UNC496MF TaxID=1502753 RepID=UPI0008E5AABD|nr:hypothetical protein [Paenibacillus sp. UNC496MF]SFJ39899.1 hypothetical protein SAMN02799624_04308 [Paenibacillus sp. UNC496MF]
MTKQRTWWLSKKWGYAASVALLPYAVLKTLWANGVVILASGKGIEQLHASMKTSADPISAFLYAKGIDITVVLALIASTLAVALVKDWGRRIPRWMLIIPAGVGGTFFISICLATFYKMAVGTIRMTDTPEFDPWVLLPVYGGFFAWGIAISMAAFSFGIRTGHYARSDV